jgi:YggT family protein
MANRQGGARRLARFDPARIDRGLNQRAPPHGADMTFPQLILTFFSDYILNLLIFIVFISVIMSWLIAFNVINAHNQFVATVWRFTTALTEPILRPIRSVLPNLGGIDLSPLVLLLAIYFLRAVIDTQLCPLVGPAQYCY